MNAPERVIPDGLEAYTPQQNQQHTSIFIQPDSSSYQPHRDVSSTGGEKYSQSQSVIGTDGARQDPHRIGGLRRRWFWLLIALISVVVIGASVGGAVGGTQANKNSGSGSASTTTSGISQPSSSTSSSTGTTSAASQTSSSTSSGTSTSTSSSASTSPTAITDCPSVNGQTYTPGDPSGGSGSYTFTKTCGGYDTDGTNLEEASVATFDDCIALCSNWNYWAESLVGIQCTSVVYLGDTSCYAKNGTQTVKSATYSDAAAALLSD